VETGLQLGGALWKLDTKWRLSLLHHTVVVDPNFVCHSHVVLVKQGLILSKITDIVSVFSSVSHSLRTGEPMHTVVPQTLLDRLLLHHHIGVVATPDSELDGHTVIGPDETQSLDHMFYTSAVVAVYQLMQVRISLASTERWYLWRALCPVLGRTTRHHTQTMRGGAVPWFREMEILTQVTAGNLQEHPLATGYYR
jgi:hypothetical protein